MNGVNDRVEVVQHVAVEKRDDTSALGRKKAASFAVVALSFGVIVRRAIKLHGEVARVAEEVQEVRLDRMLAAKA